MDAATTITVIYPDAEDALFKQYPGEQGPQECFLDLNLQTGELCVDYNANIGSKGYPESVAHRRRLWLVIPCLTGTAARELLNAVAPAAQQVLLGTTIVWNGYNHVGRLDRVAQAAYDTMAELVAQWNGDPYAPTVTEMDVEEWIREGDDPCEQYGLTADHTDAELAEMAGKVEDDIRSAADGVVVPLGVHQHLERQRDVLRGRAREELTEARDELAEITKKRNRLISRIRAWDVDSDRDIATLAGVSHTQVQRIAGALEATGEEGTETPWRVLSPRP